MRERVLGNVGALIIAVLVVVGAFAVMILQPDNPQLANVTVWVGLVLGYVFGRVDERKPLLKNGRLDAERENKKDATD